MEIRAWQKRDRILLLKKYLTSLLSWAIEETADYGRNRRKLRSCLQCLASTIAALFSYRDGKVYPRYGMISSSLASSFRSISGFNNASRKYPFQVARSAAHRYILHTVNEGISQIPWRHGWQRHSGVAITCRARESSSNIWTRYPVRLSRLECFVSPAICISTCLNGSLWDPRHDFKWNRLFVPWPEISNSITRPGKRCRNDRLIDTRNWMERERMEKVLLLIDRHSRNLNVLHVTKS